MINFQEFLKEFIKILNFVISIVYLVLQKLKYLKNSTCGVRTRADCCPADLKSASLTTRT